MLVHGTFSSTLGSFGSLAMHEEGTRFLEQSLSKYHGVFGFDHRTLSVDPMVNASELLGALRMLELPAETTIDTIGYSRGGLVYRSFAERLLPQRSLPFHLGKSVFVGCTNAGTTLAEPANWERLLDLYTNIAVAGCRAVGLVPGVGGIASILGESVKTLGCFAQYVAETSINERAVPGLAAMAPEVGLHIELNQANSTLAEAYRAAYFAIASDFEPDQDAPGFTKGLKAFLVDRMADRLMVVENDLVVDTASMSEFGLRADLLRERLLLQPRDAIYHTIYFAQPRVMQQINDWLELSPSHGGPRARPSITLSEPRPPSSRGPIKDDWVVSGGGGSGTWASDAEDDVPVIEEPSTVSDPGEGPPTPVDLEMHAEMQERPQLGKAADLRVTIAHGVIDHSDGPTSRKAQISADPDKELVLKVLAKANCRFVDESSASVPVPGRGDKEVIEFAVEGIAEGPAEVWVEVFQKRRRLSVVVLQPHFIASGVTKASASVKTDREEGAVVNLRIIDEVVAKDEPISLIFVATCPELDIDCEARSEPNSPVSRAAYVASIYREIEQRWRDASRYGSDAERDEELLVSLQGYGTNLFSELVPKEVQRKLWANRDRISSIRVITREPSIPWEILHLKDPDKAAPELGTVAFLGDIGVFRWHNDRGYPPAKLMLRNGSSGYVIPNYDDERYRLKSTDAERQFLEITFGACEIPASRRDVRKALNNCGEFDLLHFACHGSANADEIWKSGLYLEGRTAAAAYETLEAAQVSAWADLSKRPLIFLNACQVGQQASGLVGAGGLAQAFLEKGAGLIVAPLWSVGDSSALNYAKAFYETLKSGGTAADAARSARKAAKEANEPTWLAYSIYGHPYAQLQFDSDRA